VQVPGAILKPGTYRFHLTNPDTSRNVMQVLSGNGDVVYAMFHTIPDFRTRVTLDPAVTFKEVPANVPPPINTVFYGGETIGYEFLYPKGSIDMTAVLPPQPPITFSYLETPPVAEAVPEPAFAPAAEAAIEPVAAEAPAPAAPELPKTATRLPMTALTGLGLLAAGLVLAFARHNG
jgi:hypothetical protein